MFLEPVGYAPPRSYLYHPYQQAPYDECLHSLETRYCKAFEEDTENALATEQSENVMNGANNGVYVLSFETCFLLDITVAGTTFTSILSCANEQDDICGAFAVQFYESSILVEDRERKRQTKQSADEKGERNF